MTNPEIVVFLLFAASLAGITYFIHRKLTAVFNRVSDVVYSVDYVIKHLERVLYNVHTNILDHLDKAKEHALEIESRAKADAEKAAADLKAHVYTVSNEVAGVVHGKVQELSGELENVNVVLHRRLNQAFDETHAKIDLTGASILDATNKALDVFHLQSSKLADHAAELKAHAKQYQDQAAALGNSPRIAPSR